MHKKYIYIITLVSLFFSSPTVLANIVDDKTHIKINRYSYLSLKPKYDQEDLLSIVVQLKFPKDIQKIGQAINYLLKNSGYRIDKEHIDDSQYFLYGLPLPAAHRQIGPITLKSALQVLGNSGFDLVINPVKRTISYKLNKSFIAYIDSQDIENAKASWVGSLHNPKADKKEKVTVSTIFLLPDQYGPIKRGESLSSIAYSLNIQGIAIEQTMVAIYKANSSAFSHNNINLIMEGSILIIPKIKDIKEISYPLAKGLVKEHYAKWQLIISNKKGK